MSSSFFKDLRTATDTRIHYFLIFNLKQGVSNQTIEFKLRKQI